MKIAVGNQMISPSADLSERLTLVRNSGLDGVEIWLGTPDLTMQSNDTDTAALADTIRSAGLACSSVASTLGWNSPITSPDDSQFQTALQVGRRQIETAAILGADAILVVTGRVLPDVPWRQAWDRMIMGFQELCDYARPRGIRVGAETCPSLSKNLMTPGECTAFIQAVNRPNIGIYLDVANVLYSGYPEDFVRELGDRIVRIHAKDKCPPDANGKTPSTYPGNGTVDWLALRQACAEVGYDDWAVLEYPPPPGGVYSGELLKTVCRETRTAFGMN